MFLFGFERKAFLIFWAKPSRSWDAWAQSLACLFISRGQSPEQNSVNTHSGLPVITDHTHICIHRPVMYSCADAAVRALVNTEAAFCVVLFSVS